jgi:hypothetical protein
VVSEQVEEAAVPVKHVTRRGMIVSVVFPMIAWFFGSWVGLAASLAAVVVWWATERSSRLYWPVAVVLVGAAPLATWLQGLPQTPVVGADFGRHHWLANDLVIAALTTASFAALIELAHLDGPRKVAGRSHSEQVHPATGPSSG